MDRLRRALVCLLVLALVGETSGVARAFGPGATVRCCCGAHASARPCPCPDCPVTLRRAPARNAGPSHIGAARACDGADAGDPGVLHVVAVSPRAPFSIAAPFATGALASFAPSPLRTRALDPTRPPP